MQQMRRSHKWTAIAATSFILWEIACAIADVDSFPHSWEIARDFIPLAFTVFFWESVGITIFISFWGFIFGTSIALLLGISIALWTPGEKATRGTINFFRAIPSVVFLPLLIASIGASIRTSVILTTLVVTLMSINYVIRGVQGVDPLLKESASYSRLNGLDRILILYLPSMISTLGSAMRLAGARAFGTVVAAGIIVGGPGLGSALGLAASSANYSRVFSYAITMGIIGVLIYSGFTYLENKFFRWRTTV
jgi:ABC-type nitrate/sulfonate/bicarbonate transport system permease component